MTNLSGLSSGMNPDLVQTKLDELFYTIYDEMPGPGVATTTNSMVFMQRSTDRAQVNTENMNSVGLFEKTGEREDVKEATPNAAEFKTYLVAKYTNSVPVTREFMMDEMFDTVAEQVSDLAEMARVTDMITGFGIYRGAFTTTLTNAGVAVISASHTTISGDSVDNLIEGALTDETLNDAITRLFEQKNQDGVIVGQQANCLLVPAALYKTACEIVDSELRSGTANNDMNVYSSKYNLFVMQSPYIGELQGGSDTAWFLLAKRTRIQRWEREALYTYYKDWRVSDNEEGKYSAGYRNVYGVTSYEGIVGSTGL